MSEIKAHYLKGNRTKLEFRTWSKWLDAAALLAERFSREVGDDDPFAYNETASVSVLAAAAACAGFVGLAEFSTDKLAAKGKKGVPRGRSDLWILANEKSWAFEFKQFNPAGASRPLGRLSRLMQRAEECAKAIKGKDADCSVAGVVWPLYWLSKQKLKDAQNKVSQAEEHLRAFSEKCDYAWKIDGFGRAPPVYFFFNIVRG